MDPISALSLAANIFQVVGFSIDVVTISKQIYDAGSPAGFSQLEQAASNAVATADVIAKNLQESESSIDMDLRRLSAETVAIAGELKVLLERIRDQGQRSKPWGVLRQTFITIWKRDDVEKLEGRLLAVRNSLQFHTIASLKAKLDSQAIQLGDIIKNLDPQAQDSIRQLFDRFKQISDQNDRILKQQILHEDIARDRHGEIMGSVREVLRLRGEKDPGNSASPRISAEEAEATILTSLWFPTMDQRVDSIHSAYKSTYEWLFCDPVKEQKPWDNFNDFLTNDASTYWITGKPGSGKSTLMKYALTSERTRSALSQWAAGKRLIVASFYFYYQGLPLQKSSAGVLRGLLYQILSKRREWIAVAFPERLKALQLSTPDRHGVEPSYWELKKALETLMNRCPEDRFFVAVDGLDEYEADTSQMAELAEVFQTLSDLPNVKCLLSSRPWLVFERCFVGCPRLQLHELTRPDMEKYVSDQIDKWIYSKGKNSMIKSLGDEIVEHAQGVFLWVRLVLQSLLEGLNNSDSIKELRERLMELPTDLEDLYLHILRRIPERYKAQASRILQLVDCGTSNGSQLSLLGLALSEDMDEAAFYSTLVHPLSEQAVCDGLCSMRARLASRCVGLIEVYRIEPKPGMDWIHRFDFDSDCYENWIEDRTGYLFVRFLHRTVFEFLKSPAINGKWGQTIALTESATYEPQIALLRLLVLRIKTYPGLTKSRVSEDGKFFNRDLRALVFYTLRTCRRAERSTGRAQTHLLMELDKVMAHFYTILTDGADIGHWHKALEPFREDREKGKARNQGDTKPGHAENDLLSLAQRYNLKRFVEDRQALVVKEQQAPVDKGQQALVESRGRKSSKSGTGRSLFSRIKRALRPI